MPEKLLGPTLRNSRLAKLQAYPFEKLRALLAGGAASATHSPINLSIGEPKHPTPALIKEAFVEGLDGLAAYPATAGTPALKNAIGDWLRSRYHLEHLDPATQVLPVNGSREALFSFAQTAIDPADPGKVAIPNPFYQIYEGAALLAGAEPVYLNTVRETGFRLQFGELDEAEWRKVRLIYVCSPANPCGNVMQLEEWRALFELADRHGFMIASDECYSELYFDEARAPLGALQAAQALGRKGFERLVVFSSLSKRSNAPGMRSGFAAGDAQALREYLLYRTYHGSAMSQVVQQASIAAWRDELHVRENRRLYAEKFKAVLPLLSAPLEAYLPDGGFYLWMLTPIDDKTFARELWRQYNVLVVPGSFLAREANGINPGAGYVRIALVAPLHACVAAIERINAFGRTL